MSSGREWASCLGTVLGRLLPVVLGVVLLVAFPSGSIAWWAGIGLLALGVAMALPIILAAGGWGGAHVSTARWSIKMYSAVSQQLASEDPAGMGGARWAHVEALTQMVSFRYRLDPENPRFKRLIASISPEMGLYEFTLSILGEEAHLFENDLNHYTRIVREVENVFMRELKLSRDCIWGSAGDVTPSALALKLYMKRKIASVAARS